MITSIIIIGLVWLFSGEILEQEEKERLIVWANIPKSDKVIILFHIGFTFLIACLTVINILPFIL